eukprot:12182049-Heterocapsa_arctica.AAC.1
MINEMVNIVLRNVLDEGAATWIKRCGFHRCFGIFDDGAATLIDDLKKTVERRGAACAFAASMTDGL